MFGIFIFVFMITSRIHKFYFYIVCIFFVVMSNLSTYIQSSIPKFVFSSHIFNNSALDTSYHIYLSADKYYIKRVITFLFLDINVQSKCLVDIAGVDFPSKLDRFNLIYNFLSVINNYRFFLSVWVNELDKISSITSLHPCASWYEREVWDLYGIHFEGNNDLRRILTDYGFLGHPLRKDFPLSGFTELYYNSRVDSIIHQPISLIQEYRQFDTLSPWEWF